MCMRQDLWQAAQRSTKLPMLFKTWIPYWAGLGG